MPPSNVPPSEPHWVYRLRDRAGHVTYVGCTSLPEKRLRWHQAHWGEHLGSVVWQRYPNKRAALDAERALIEGLRPPWNVQHNLGHVHKPWWDTTDRLRAIHRGLAA